MAHEAHEHVPPSDLLAEILLAAERHGRASDPDHEVGDLQDALRIAWPALSARERRRVHHEFFRDHERWADHQSPPRR